MRLQLVHSDKVGPMKTPFVGDCTKFSPLLLMFSLNSHRIIPLEKHLRNFGLKKLFDNG